MAWHRAHESRSKDDEKKNSDFSSNLISLCSAVAVVCRRTIYTIQHSALSTLTHTHTHTGSFANIIAYNITLYGSKMGVDVFFSSLYCVVAAVAATATAIVVTSGRCEL